MTSLRHILAAVTFAAATLASVAATASPFDVHGPGGRSSGMAGAQTASPDGPGAVYDNIGGLAGVEPGLQVGVFSTTAEAPILLKDRPDGYDVPDLEGSDALPSDETRRERRDTDSPSGLTGVVGGAVTDFGTDGTRGGVVVMIPTGGLIAGQTRFADERERAFSNQLHHELIGSRLHRPVVEMGVARELTDRISVGVGGTWLPGTTMSTEAYLAEPADQSNADLNTEIETSGQWGLLTGVVAELPHKFEAGLAFRQGVSFEVEGANEVQVRGMPAGGDESRQQMHWIPTSTPSSIRAGLARQFGAVEATVDARYTFWSTYRDTQGRDAGFDDTLQGRLGAEWEYSENTRLRAGTGFVPTPVPAQTGRTNYVDNSRALLSVGGGHDVSVLDRQLTASWHVRFQHLVVRDTDKRRRDDYPDCTPGETALCDEVPDDLENPETGQPYEEAQGLQTGNPGFPGFVSGGWLASVGLQVRY